ncbi:MAG: hypothetical protein J6R28_07890, partial [Bacteroides sp.]|nr:hypothetical protein [Bacteroides sp.]
LNAVSFIVAHVFHGVFPCCCIPSPSIGTYRVDSFGKGYDTDFAIEKEEYRSCPEVNAGFLPRKE